MKIFLILSLLLASSNAIGIQCHLEMSGWTPIGVFWTCVVRSIDTSLNETHVTGITGVTPQQIQRINFPCSHYNINMTIIPSNFNDFFPNLIGIDYWGCPVGSLSGSELENYPNLEWLSINSSPLTFTRVPGNLFSKNKKLRLVYISFNALQHVGDGLLDNLPNLHWAVFIDNTCINQRADVPEEIPALIESLRQNCRDIEQEMTTTTTIQPQKCEIDNFEDFVCGLEEEIEVLRDDNKNLQNQVSNMNSEIDEIKGNLYELERIVQDLMSRPCAC